MKLKFWILISLVTLTQSAAFSQYIFPYAIYTESSRKASLSNFDIVEDYLYFPLGEDGLQIFNIEDPTNFKLVGKYEEFEKRSRKKIYGTANKIIVSGDTAFLAYGDLGLKILSVEDPSMPFVLGTYYRHHPVFCTAVYQNFAVVGMEKLGIEIVDYSNLEDIKMVSRNNLKDFPTQNIIIQPPYIIITGKNRGLNTFKFGEPFTDFKISGFPKEYLPDNDANKLIIEGKTGYLANDFRGLTILSMGLPLYPLELANIKTTGSAMDVVVENNYAYVATDKAIQIFDVSEPDKPRPIFEHKDRKKAYHYLKIEGNFLYASFKEGSRGYGIQIFQIE